jgi:16S rRNA (guanine527-N7)-methyltransferase
MNPTSDKLELSVRVSRETLRKLEAFVELVQRWNAAINLIARSTVADVWNRHIVDSVQLIRFCPPQARVWLDMGSGGGFPGLVVAVLAQEHVPALRVALVESDKRKAAFLQQAARELQVDCTVHCARIEAMAPQAADVVSARALAPLEQLIGFAARHSTTDGLGVFPKGVSFAEEVATARRTWRFDIETHASAVKSGAALLLVRNIDRAQQQ